MGRPAATDASDRARFMRVVAVPDDAADCWPWSGSTKGNGYGQFWLRGRSIGAHVASHRIHNGPVPEGMVVMHLCDNRICVNPMHLEIGTPMDNVRMAMEHGLTARSPHRYCKHGHPMSLTAKINSSGNRECSWCSMYRKKMWELKKYPLRLVRKFLAPVSFDDGDVVMGEATEDE